MTTVHSIGHSNHAIERFIDLLRQHGVTTLVDVRSHPYSRWAPQFRKEALSRALTAAGIAYVFLGDALGGRPKGKEFYDAKGHVDYQRRSAAPGFQEGVDRVVEIAQTRAVAILCAEEDPTRCHRRSLVTPALQKKEIAVLHIRGDGRVQSDDELRRGKDQLSLWG